MLFAGRAASKAAVMAAISSGLLTGSAQADDTVAPLTGQAPQGQADGWRIENDPVETLPGTTVTVRVYQVVSGDNSKACEAMHLHVVDGKMAKRSMR